jgi:hypothetical protein
MVARVHEDGDPDAACAEMAVVGSASSWSEQCLGADDAPGRGPAAVQVLCVLG